MRSTMRTGSGAIFCKCSIFSFSLDALYNTTRPQACLGILIWLLYAHPPPPPRARGVGGYNHHDIGDEVDWRPPLLYAYPLGHRVPATREICQKCVKYQLLGGLIHERVNLGLKSG